MNRNSPNTPLVSRQDNDPAAAKEVEVNTCAYVFFSVVFSFFISVMAILLARTYCPKLVDFTNDEVKNELVIVVAATVIFFVSLAAFMYMPGWLGKIKDNVIMLLRDDRRVFEP